MTEIEFKIKLIEMGFESINFYDYYSNILRIQISPFTDDVCIISLNNTLYYYDYDRTMEYIKEQIENSIDL